MPPQRRAERAAKWLCRFCKHKTTGQDWWNGAAMSSCGMCGRAKGICYKADVAPPAPSVKKTRTAAAKDQSPWAIEKAAKLEKAELENKQLKQQLQQLKKQQQPVLDAEGDAAMGVDEADSDGIMRQKIKSLDHQIHTASHELTRCGESPLWSSLLANLRQEKADLQAKLMASRPHGVRMQGLTAKIKQSEADIAKREAALQVQADQIQQLEKAKLDMEQQLATQREALVQLNAELHQLSAAQLKPPDQPSLGAPCPVLQVDATKLGTLLQGFGIQLDQAAQVAPQLAAQLGQCMSQHMAQVFPANTAAPAAEPALQLPGQGAPAAPGGTPGGSEHAGGQPASPAALAGGPLAPVVAIPPNLELAVEQLNEFLVTALPEGIELPADLPAKREAARRCMRAADQVCPRASPY